MTESIKPFAYGVSLAVLLAHLGVALAAQTAPDLPSGQSVTLKEVLIDTVGQETWIRFRFIAPEIGENKEAITYDEAGADMQLLCDDLAIPYLSEQDLSADVVVISFSQKAVPFGQADPETTQFFDAYRLLDGRCEWEMF
ncbi:MAG: DUF6497 family protein [Pseudomonadota bacterium]